MSKTYAQNGEDLIIGDYFKNQKGTLLDIGANDGITLSNTYKFMSNDWEGVLIEPSKIAYNELKKNYINNKNAHLFNVAIGEKCDEVIFWESGTHLNIGDNSLLSTINESELKRWENTNNEFVKKTTTVWDFNTLLSSSKIKKFNLISIDIEGSEIFVLPQINLLELETKCIIIEYNNNNDLFYTFNDYITSFGMRLIHKNYENLIYVI